MSKHDNNVDKNPPVDKPGDKSTPSESQVDPNPNNSEDLEAIKDLKVSESEQSSSINLETKHVSIEMGFAEDHVTPNPNDVCFEVSYKKNFEGKKRHQEGAILTISKESALQFEKLGIGKIVKTKK